MSKIPSLKRIKYFGRLAHSLISTSSPSLPANVCLYSGLPAGTSTVPHSNSRRQSRTTQLTTMDTIDILDIRFGTPRWGYSFRSTHTSALLCIAFEGCEHIETPAYTSFLLCVQAESNILFIISQISASPCQWSQCSEFRRLPPTLVLCL